MSRVSQLVSGLRNVVAFQTIIPVGMDDDGLQQAASHMPLFPFVGGLIGLGVGIVVWLLQFVVPPLLSAAVGVGLLLLVNGVQHLDGLLDVGDGLMFHGTRSGKLQVMRDPATGAGGFALGLIVLLITIFSLAAVPSALTIPALTTSEAAAMFAMVLATAVGKSAHKGLNSVFVAAMRSQRGLRVIFSYLIVLIISYFALKSAGIILVLAASIVAVVMVSVSNRSFGGLTGDVLGATNEITRSISLALLLVLLKWA